MRRNLQGNSVERTEEAFDGLEALERRALMSTSTVVMPSLGVTLDVRPVVEAKLDAGDTFTSGERNQPTYVPFIPKVKLEVVVYETAGVAGDLAAADKGRDEGIEGSWIENDVGFGGDDSGSNPTVPPTDCDLPPPHDTPSPCD